MKRILKSELEYSKYPIAIGWIASLIALTILLMVVNVGKLESDEDAAGLVYLTIFWGFAVLVFSVGRVNPAQKINDRTKLYRLLPVKSLNLGMLRFGIILFVFSIPLVIWLFCWLLYSTELFRLMYPALLNFWMLYIIAELWMFQQERVRDAEQIFAKPRTKKGWMFMLLILPAMYAVIVSDPPWFERLFNSLYDNHVTVFILLITLLASWRYIVKHK